MTLRTGLVGVLATLSLLVAGRGNAQVAALSVTIKSGPPRLDPFPRCDLHLCRELGRAAFTCSLDRHSASPCTSPQRYRGLETGRHIFTVKAVLRREQASDSRAWTIVSDAPPPPPAKHCPANTICFDDLSPGTTLKSQYQAKGIELSLNQSDQSGTAAPCPRSPPTPRTLGRQIALVPPCGKDFCSSTIYARLDHAVHHVEIYAGSGSPVSLTRLNTAGSSRADDQTDRQGRATLLSITTLTHQIVYLQISEIAPPSSNSLVELDDLKFDPPDRERSATSAVLAAGRTRTPAQNLGRRVDFDPHPPHAFQRLEGQHRLQHRPRQPVERCQHHVLADHMYNSKAAQTR